MTAHPQPRPGAWSLLTRGPASPDVDALPLAGAPTPDTTRWVRAVLADTVPAMAAVSGRLVALREGRKRLAVLHPDDGPSLVLKQYSDDRGAWTQRWMQRLAEAGMAPPARLSVTPARGWSPAHKTLVADLALGAEWSGSLQAPAAERDAAAVAAADWLVELAALPVTLPDRTGYRAGEDLRRHSGELADEHPTRATRLLGVSGTAQSRLYGDPRAGADDLVASHGDLHPANLFVASGGPLAVTAIDVDTAGLRRPSYDVGYALAQLLVASWMRTGSFAAGASAGAAFWQRWSAHDGRDADAVPAQVVRALVQSLHFELVVYRNGRTDLLEPWLAVAETVLADGVPATLHALTTSHPLTTAEEPTP